MRAGYAKKTIESNTQELIEVLGLSEERAKAAAMKHGRKAYRKKNPDKPFPDYLKGEND